MIEKIIKIYKEETFKGFYLRIKKRYFFYKFKISKKLGFKTITSSYGVKFTSNYKDLTFQFYFFGSYGYRYWQYIKNINNPFIFIDIGANQGLYTIGAAKNKNCIKCYSFEPVNNTFRYLKKNIYLNLLEKKCILINSAISEKTGTSIIKQINEHSGGATISKKKKLDDKGRKIFSSKINTICSKNLDEIIKNQNYVPIKVKIDVEGHELVVISQLMKTKICQYIDEIYYEIDEKWINPSKITNILKKKGFKYFSKKPKGKRHYDVLATKKKIIF